MSSMFDKLNLRPNERRLVIVVGIVVFILLNFFFVWPHFADWGKLQKRKREANALLIAFQDEIRRTPQHEAQLANLRQQGASVASEEQALKLSTTIYNQAALSGVQINRYTPQIRTSATVTKTNQFFEEQTGTATIAAEEKALVDFLYNLGVGGSLIRVRSMNLSPDPQRQRLQGDIVVVASYAKRPPVRAAAPAAVARTNSAASARSTNTGARPSSPFARTTNSPRSSR
jgi:hypothetical protein